MLLDSGQVFSDQQAEVERASQRRGMDLDPSLLTDGLLGERARGVTMDLAHRPIVVGSARALLVDCPGHVEYTANLFTGLAGADIAIVLVDAVNGITEGTLRHLTFVSWARVPAVWIVVNKLDLLHDQDATRFASLAASLRSTCAALHIHNPVILPLSARDGANVVHPHPRLAWFHGPTLWDSLSAFMTSANIKTPSHPSLVSIQGVARAAHPDHAGVVLHIRVLEGAVGEGDRLSNPLDKTETTIGWCGLGPASRLRAQAGQCATLVVDRPVGATGTLLIQPDCAVQLSTTFTADAVAFQSISSTPARRWVVRHLDRSIAVTGLQIQERIAFDGARTNLSAANLARGEAGRVTLTLASPLVLPVSGGPASRRLLLCDSEAGTVAAALLLSL